MVQATAHILSNLSPVMLMMGFDASSPIEIEVLKGRREACLKLPFSSLALVYAIREVIVESGKLEIAYYS